MQKSSAIPCLRYRDAPAAIDWLRRVFGFEKHLVVPDTDGGIAHAQLTLGGGMIMLGSVAVRKREYWCGFGIGFALQSTFMLVLDLFAESRAADYVKVVLSI